MSGRRWSSGNLGVNRESAGSPEAFFTNAAMMHTARGEFSIKILSGSAHPKLAELIAHKLGLPLSQVLCGQFSNGETRVEIANSCRGCDCYVIQPVCNTEDGKKSVNDMLMELLIMISALRGSSAERITAVMPIYGYARQDKKDKSRAAISARLVADLLCAAGCDRTMTVDLHASQIQGFFVKPCDNLYAEDLLCQHLKELLSQYRKANDGAEIVVVSPDAGGAKRASRVAGKITEMLGKDCDCAIISKERLKANEVSSMRLVGSVKDSICIIVDDMADTCGTLALAAKTLVDAGAVQVHAYIVHGVLSGPAIQRINDCQALNSVVVTNTVPQSINKQNCSKLQVVDVSALLAAAINCTHSDNSISALFRSPTLLGNPRPIAIPKFSLNNVDLCEYKDDPPNSETP